MSRRAATFCNAFTYYVRGWLAQAPKAAPTFDALCSRKRVQVDSSEMLRSAQSAPLYNNLASNELAITNWYEKQGD
jgi:hypothetical protein